MLVRPVGEIMIGVLRKPAWMSALAGLGTLSEARQLLFASLLLADQMLDGKEPSERPPEPPPAAADPALQQRVEALAERLEAIADRLPG